MINTRLIYLPISHPNAARAAFIKIQEILEQSIYIKIAGDDYYLYGHQNSLLAGLEVLGREENFYHHDELKVKDFNAAKVESKTIHFKDYQDLLSQVQNTLQDLGLEWFRIQLDPQVLNQCVVYFFDNKEK